MSNYYDSFMGIYKVQKTVRNELIPVGKTKDFIDRFVSEQNEILQADKERADAYPFVKEILDDYYREFFNEVLSDFNFPEDDLQKAFILYKASIKDRSQQKDLSKFELDLRNSVASALEKSKSKYALDKNKTLFNEKNGLLNSWLDRKYESGSLSKDEYEKAKKNISRFSNFSVYFTGYQQNRENMFSNEEKSTSVAFRIVNENMIRFFNNCLNFDAVCHTYPELQSKLQKYADFFVPSAFNKVISQNGEKQGIGYYNKKILGQTEQGKESNGVNQIINLYRQKNGLKSKEVPVMAKLYRQILSVDENEKEELIEINSDQELFTVVSESAKKAASLSETLKTLLQEKMAAENFSNMFIRTDSLANLSNQLFGNWYFIKSALINAGIKKITEEYISLAALQDKLNAYIQTLDEKPDISITESLTGYFLQNMDERIKKAFESAQPSLSLQKLDADRSLPSTQKPDGGKGFRQVAPIKELMDAIQEAIHLYNLFLMEFDGKEELPEEIDKDFYARFSSVFPDLKHLTKSYDMVRNYVTRKPYSTDKYKINFDRPTLLAGWDVNKEKDNLCVIFREKDQYYLGIMAAASNKLLDEESKYICPPSEEHYEKMVYKQVSGSSKMFPKVFFAKANDNLFSPSDEILEIREKGLYRKSADDLNSLHKWIDFCKNCIAKHPEWSHYFQFHFKETNQYSNINEFYKDADDQMYNLSFINVKKSYIDNAVEKGQLYLFQIYNKDRSAHSKGRENLHTIYWDNLFSEENMDRIAHSNEPVFKLNGEAEIFFRKASLESEKPTHPANKSIQNKQQPGKALFPYDIIKDKRYTQNKLFFHCPLTINYRADDTKSKAFNTAMNKAVLADSSVKIIGIDRGERHLLYYSIIDQQGRILEQNSLNLVGNGEGETVDYHKILSDKEIQRQNARQSWGEIEQIKDIKTGYLSQIVHRLSDLMIKNNAVIVLENLNGGFKNSRIKIEKQVYQRFEQALIDKMNYLVFKDRSADDPGGSLHGYQLAAPFESFEKLHDQSGILYYVVPSYTSKIDPVTGFVSFLNLHYENREKSCLFIKKLTGFAYHSEADEFEIGLDYRKFGKFPGKQEWTICASNQSRYIYNHHENKYECILASDEFKKLFDSYGIEYRSGCDLRQAAASQQSADFFRQLLRLIQITWQLRYTASGASGDEDDYILSPVRDEKGNFFDSRKLSDEDGGVLEPKNADANGAYHIALKGLLLLKRIQPDGTLKRVPDEKADWIDFAQNKKQLLSE